MSDVQRSLSDVKLASFHLLASEGAVHDAFALLAPESEPVDPRL